MDTAPYVTRYWVSPRKPGRLFTKKYRKGEYSYYDKMPKNYKIFQNMMNLDKKDNQDKKDKKDKEMKDDNDIAL
jgi:hypothetical protein